MSSEHGQKSAPGRNTGQHSVRVEKKARGTNPRRCDLKGEPEARRALHTGAVERKVSEWGEQDRAPGGRGEAQEDELETARDLVTRVPRESEVETSLLNEVGRQMPNICG